MQTIQQIKQKEHPRCVLAYEWFEYWNKYARVNYGEVTNNSQLFQEFCNQYGIKGSFLDMCRYERMQCNQCK